ncbi:SRPBCC family protein [Flavitalea flava]
MKKSINQQYFFDHSPEVVWEYLTNPDLLQLWLMKNDFQPVIGHDFQFRTNPIPSLDFDGICYCRVLELVPFQKLSYSWKGGPGEGKITLDTLVVWTLQRKGEGTELSLMHGGFSIPENFSFFTGMTDGWLKNLQKIEKHINAAKNGTTNT